MPSGWAPGNVYWDAGSSLRSVAVIGDHRGNKRPSEAEKVLDNMDVTRLSSRSSSGGVDVKSTVGKIGHRMI